MSNHFNNNLITCPKCTFNGKGTGLYIVGIENDQPVTKGTCNSCSAKGWQGIANVKRNYGYNKSIHWSPDGEPNHGMATSSTMAEGVYNDILHHDCNLDIARKACAKHGGKLITNIGGNGETYEFYDHSTLAIHNTKLVVGYRSQTELAV